MDLASALDEHGGQAQASEALRQGRQVEAAPDLGALRHQRRLSSGGGGLGRDDDRARTACPREQRGGGRRTELAIEHDTDRIAPAAEARRQPRIIGEHRTHTDKDCIVAVAQAHHVLARRRPRDPLRIAGDGGDLPVERDGGLERERRALVPRPREERQVRALAGLAEHARRHRDLRLLEQRGAAAMTGDRIHRTDHHPRDAARANERRAWRGPAVVVARLEVHVQRGTLGLVVELLQRRALGVILPRANVRSSAITSPRRSTITQPTIGFGEVRPR